MMCRISNYRVGHMSLVRQFRDMKEISNLDWDRLYNSLETCGHAQISSLLTKAECESLIQTFPNDAHFRSTIVMERYRFGKGTYRYFNYPIPSLIDRIRKDFYVGLAPIANRWMMALGIDIIYPDQYDEFIDTCHHSGQTRPTPLILRYDAGGFNTLHQDLYGTVYFPFQIVVMLTEAGVDYHGGELVFTEQLPRAQSKATVIAPGLGDAVIFTTNFRPVKGSRGFYRSRMKHGISEVLSGTRYACGIILHDAA